MESWIENNNFVDQYGIDEEEEEDILVSDPDLDAAIAETDAKFKKACQQLILLNNHIDGIQVRYDRAAKNSCRMAKYNYRIKLCVVEGVRNMFYEYAVRLADKIDDLRRQAGMIVLREEDEEGTESEEEEEEEEEEEGDSMEVDEQEEGYHSEDNSWDDWAEWEAMNQPQVPLSTPPAPPVGLLDIPITFNMGPVGAFNYSQIPSAPPVDMPPITYNMGPVGAFNYSQIPMANFDPLPFNISTQSANTSANESLPLTLADLTKTP